MEEAKKTLITSEQQSIIDAGGRVESFYDTFEENQTEGELIEYKRSIGMPITDDYDELMRAFKDAFGE